MSKFMDNNKANHSVEINEVLVDSNINNSEDKNHIYKAGKEYYQYLKKIKLEDFDEGSDYCTSFMMF